MEIYLGSGIEYASERALLEKIGRAIVSAAEEAIVLANVNLGGRQIDFVLCLENRTIVLEAKGYTRPVRGGQNGVWQAQLATGRWKDVDNAYRQALDAKNALRDEMNAFARAQDAPYPSAAVVFVPVIPARSELESGDFKVSVVALGKLEEVIRSASSNAWSLDQWRAFARYHRLIPVTTIEAACDDRMRADVQLLAAYSTEFSRTYGPDVAHLVPFACRSGGSEDMPSDDVVHEIVHEESDVLLCGPSGCGKSLLGQRVGLSTLETGGVPIAIAAKHYEGSIKGVLDREVGLLAPCSASRLLAAARRQSRRILLIVDGYNECREDRREELTRSIASLTRRFECSILVTSRCALTRHDLMPLRHIDVPAPSETIKWAIASQGREGIPLSPQIELLLQAITSGLEARLIGEVGQNLGPQASRHEVFDAFTRGRLGGGAREGIKALAKIAQWMYEHVTFSVSIRDLDRLAHAEQIASPTLSQLIENGLLRSRAGRLSFSHELFLHAFAAEAVVRRSAEDPDAIIKALHDPRHADRLDLIVGALDDAGTLSKVLQHIPDASLVASCLSGACGRFARDWIDARYPQVLNRMREEVKAAQCVLSSAGAWGASVTSKEPMGNDAADCALVQHLPILLSQGVYLREVFDLARTLDDRLAHQCSVLRDQARQKHIGLKSAVFAEAYGLVSSQSLALSRVCVQLHSNLFQVTNSLLPDLARLASAKTLTPGQLYIIASLCRHLEGGPGAVALAQIVTGAIEQYGQGAPYHLQLALVEAARHCGVVSQEPDIRLIDALKSMLDNRNIGLNGLIFDVLQQFGAFETETSNLEPEIREKIALLLCSPDEAECWTEADHIYNSQFDGPYSDAYWEVVNGLPDAQRKTFLEMAAKGAQYANLFLSVLLSDLAAFNDPRTEAVFRLWAKAPPADSFMPQEAIEAFVIAHVALARLRIDLPRYVESGATECALYACGRLLYWPNRVDASQEVKGRAIKDAWTTLDSNGPHQYAMNVLAYCSRMMIRSMAKLPGGTPVRLSIPDLFPSEAVSICRRSLSDPEIQAGYFRSYGQHDRIQDEIFALSILGEQGQSLDLPFLRTLALSPNLGHYALKAVHRLEERLSSTEIKSGVGAP